MVRILLSIAIPAFNEAKAIGLTLDRIPELGGIVPIYAD